MTAPRLCIVVLHWNRRDETIACLASVREQLRDGDTVLLVDNASSDGSLAAVRAAHPWVEVLEAPANLGFAGGNNLGMRWALDRRYPWIMLLNDDTVVPPGGIDALLRHASRRDDVGAVQPLLVQADDPARVDSAGHVVHPNCGMSDALTGASAQSVGDQPREVFGACAAASLLRADALAAAGLLDEELFVLFEDADLSFRLQLAGYRTLLAPDVHVRHHRGVSGSPRSRLRRFWAQRNSIALAVRYWPRRALLGAAPLLLVRAAAALGNALLLPGQRCLPLWWRALRERPGYRRRMRALGVDRWLGAEVASA